MELCGYSAWGQPASGVPFYINYSFLASIYVCWDQDPESEDFKKVEEYNDVIAQKFRDLPLDFLDEILKNPKILEMANFDGKEMKILDKSKWEF